MRFIPGAIVGLLVAASTTYVSQPISARADEVVTPKVEAVDVASASVPAAASAAVAAHAPSDLVAELRARRTDDFGLVGVTWARGFDARGMAVQVRLRTQQAWGSWETLHIESDEAEGGRDGTEALWVGSADGIAVRVTSPTGERPAGLSVSTIDPGTTPTEASAAAARPAFHDSSTDTLVTEAADGSPAYTARPPIISRASWGARKNTYCDSPRTGNETRGVVVHHTAGTNSYSKSQSAGIVRAVQAYHMQGRDWCDIGYNFLVDKYGQIFAGRNGAVDQPVRAAHAGDTSVNTYTMGVSMMGTFTKSEPTSATKDAVVRLVGWRLGTTFHPATGTYGVGHYRLNRIAGHRDVVGTECPGQAAYAWLSRTDGLRDRVAAYVADYSSDIRTRVKALGSSVTGPVFVGEYPFGSGGGGRKARLAKVDVYSSPSGTFSTSDHFRTRYDSLQAQSGVLGVPTSTTLAASRPTVRVQRFAKGTIYRVVRTTTAAYGLWGAMEDKYRDLGEESGALGAPTSSEAAISGGRYRAYFVNGNLTRQAGGAVTVALR